MSIKLPEYAELRPAAYQLIIRPPCSLVAAVIFLQGGLDRHGSVDQQHNAGAGQPHQAGAGDKQGVGHHQAVNKAGQQADRIFQWADVLGRG